MSQRDGLPPYYVTVSRIRHFTRFAADLAIFRRTAPIVSPFDIPRYHLMVARRTSPKMLAIHLRTARWRTTKKTIHPMKKRTKRGQRSNANRPRLSTLPEWVHRPSMAKVCVGHPAQHQDSGPSRNSEVRSRRSWRTPLLGCSRGSGPSSTRMTKPDLERPSSLGTITLRT